VHICVLRLRVIVIVYKVTSSSSSRVVVCISYLPMSPSIDSKAKASCLPSIFQPWSLLFRQISFNTRYYRHYLHYRLGVGIVADCAFFLVRVNLRAKIREVSFLALDGRTTTDG